MKIPLFFKSQQIAIIEKNKMRMFLKDGIEFYDDQDKLYIATDFFTSIFGITSFSLPAIDVSQVYELADMSMLIQPSSWGDIVSLIDKLPNNRSSGPNGFTNEFYMAFKHTMKDDLICFLQYFYDHKADIRQINTSNMVLPPKKEAPVNIKDFRPISLVHSVGVKTGRSRVGGPELCV